MTRVSQSVHAPKCQSVHAPKVREGALLIDQQRGEAWQALDQRAHWHRLREEARDGYDGHRGPDPKKCSTSSRYPKKVLAFEAGAPVCEH